MRVAFDLNSGGRVRLGVFDVAGRMVQSLADEAMEGQRHYQLSWSGSDHAGKRARPGLYFIRLEAEGKLESRPVILQR